MPLDNQTLTAARLGGDYILPFDRVLVGKDPRKPALVPGHQMVRVDAAQALVGDTSEQPMFVAAADSLNVEASAHYRFRCVAHLTTGATSASVAFSLNGSATFTTSFALGSGIAAASGTPGTLTMNNSVALETAFVVVAAGTGVNKRFIVEGEFETLAAGTIIPSVTFSADPQGDETVNVGTFFECWKTSDSAGLVSIGNFG
jgi:hypothetical protein